MKPMKRLLCALLAALFLVPAAVAAPASSGGGKCSDIQGHWAQQQIEEAIAQGWVNGYPDGTFRPNGTITKAEYTKLLLGAFRMTPGSETVRWMKSSAKKLWDKGWTREVVDYQPTLTDMSKHWLTTQGWLDAALYSGLVVPTDYEGGKFNPDQAIPRYTMALQTVRAMGLVGPAQTVSTDDLTYSDNAQIQDWVKGYVKVAAQNNVMSGYPDGSFGPKRTATRAEAVVTILRALEYNKGDGEIQATLHVVYHEAYSGGKALWEEDRNDVRMLAADGRIYVNLLDLFDAFGLNKHTEEGWQYTSWLPIPQVVLTGSEALYAFQMGNSYWEGDDYNYVYWRTPAPDHSWPLLGPVRSYYGQPMVPMYDFNRPEKQENGRDWSEYQGKWDPATKTLSVGYAEPTRYIS